MYNSTLRAQYYQAAQEMTGMDSLKENTKNELIHSHIEQSEDDFTKAVEAISTMCFNDLFNSFLIR